ncbi:hypothetical protein BX666DRAFT_1900039 [Dichotomocladium elegans]|nr:hypothetical protein BX666DRAFT_1900039 [Dichotomocladium elegans]
MAPAQHQSSPLYPEFNLAYSLPRSSYYHCSSGCGSSNNNATIPDRYAHPSPNAPTIVSTGDSKKQRLPAPHRPLPPQSSPEGLRSGNIPLSAITTSITSTTTQQPSMYYFTWLVFLKEKWVPFDAANQTKLEQTLTLGGTFVDVTDTHFPNVKRVRVFPRSNYLSYLGVKYRLSRIMQPDAWLDYEARENDHRYSSIAD